MNNEYLEIESDSDKKIKSNEEDIRDNKIIVRLMILFVVNKNIFEHFNRIIWHIKIVLMKDNFLLHWNDSNVPLHDADQHNRLLELQVEKHKCSMEHLRH